MRILHTSDWHLGNRWKDKSREEEFDAFLKWLLGVMEEQKVDVLLVSGQAASTFRELCGNLDGKTTWDIMLETLGNKMYDCVTI